MQVSAAAALLAAFDDHERDIRLRNSRVAHVLIILLVPAGTTLDWFVYPRLIWELLLVRLGVAVLASLALALHYTAFARRHVRWFAMLAPLIVNMAVSWMVLRSEGARSPYYAGLNLVLAGIGVLLPWSFAEAALACGFTLVFYCTACILHGNLVNEKEVFFNNVYFLTLTSIICATAVYFKSKARFEEFRLSSELARSYQQVSEVERLKTEFFANISHELRTPLTLILVPLQDVLASGQKMPPGLEEPIRLARDNSLRLLKLINDLLEVARLESEEFTLQAEPIELCHFVNTQVDSVRPLARLKGLDLKVEHAPAALWVTVDPAQVEKILVNLLTNAIKFTPRSAGILVCMRREGHAAVVDVVDKGIGVSEADLPHIFDRFRRADSSAAGHVSGVGIGLSLAKEIAEKHGGTLSAESRPGQGSTFRLRLPLRPRESELPAPAAETVAATAPLPATKPSGADDSLAALLHDADRFVPVEPEPKAESHAARSRGGQGAVLVIDDEPDMRRYLASILADQYTVLQASDGREGLDLARRAKPELVVVDLMMREVDGWQVCASLKENRNEESPKVVVVTARTDEMAKITALKSGADDFISKPFSTLEVRTRLTNQHRTFELERSLRQQNHQLTEALEKLQAAEARLVQREKMKAVVRMAGGILHEINNPLNFTLTAIGIALERHSEQESPLAAILRDVQAGMVRIRDIVVDLRSFANPSISDGYEPVDLADLVDQALRFTAVELAGIQVEREIRQDCVAYGSRSQLLQVLTNLLLNAGAAVRQVTWEREPTISVTAEALAGRTRVRVWDNGSGIPADLLDKVFDPFLTTHDVGEGMGLGLSICHALIAAHGGEIRVQSQPGSWTEVVFELPPRQKGVAA